ncbi:GntR family transcriptional regulator [Rossellomorea marisflavi]|uniref:GntR family transcriptional regulator n=1 Tax=Rossellomorea marisflavi TaxID=189381 RepID=UPI0011E8273C|nr:GntR family transcriptional regulator [Rossellomorea marisflavi]QHA37785.1 GntR family transcriptional regulator [Rossellomorea marisflavi]TYO74536.1 GntR family transcriptional regulator [Rossellomorea marisflavi]
MIIKKTLAGQAFQMLRKQILSGELSSGDELPEKRLAEEYGISRTPIREALRKLAAEGLVTISEAKVAVVASFTEEDGLQHLEIRELLEVYNLDVIPGLGEGLMGELDDNLEAQHRAILEDRYDAFIDLDRRFHLLLAAPNPNPKLKEMIKSSNTGVNRAFLGLSGRLRMSAMEAYEEHVRLVRFLKVGDRESAKRQMRHHMTQIRQRMQGYYREDR